MEIMFLLKIIASCALGLFLWNTFLFKLGLLKKDLKQKKIVRKLNNFTYLFGLVTFILFFINLSLYK